MEEKADEAERGVRPGNAGPLDYRGQEPRGPGVPRVAAIIAICVILGLLAVVLFVIGVAAITSGSFVGVLFCGLGGLLVYRIGWHVRSLGSRK